MVPGSYVLVVMGHGLDFVVSILACFYMCVVPIVIPPPLLTSTASSSAAKLSSDARPAPSKQEDLDTISTALATYPVSFILLDGSVDEFTLKAKVLESASTKRKPSAKDKTQIPRFPESIYVHRLPKVNRSMEESFHDVSIRQAASTIGITDFSLLHHWAVIQVFSLEQAKPFFVHLTNTSLLHEALIQKCSGIVAESEAIFSCLLPYNGLGFLHATVLGIFMGVTTRLLNPVDVLLRPQTFLDLVQNASGLSRLAVSYRAFM